MKTQHQNVRVKQPKSGKIKVKGTSLLEPGVLNGCLVFLQPHSTWVVRSPKSYSKGFGSSHTGNKWGIFITVLPGTCVGGSTLMWCFTTLLRMLTVVSIPFFAIWCQSSCKRTAFSQELWNLQATFRAEPWMAGYGTVSFFLETLAPNLQSEPTAMVGVLHVLCFPLPFITQNAETRISNSKTWVPAGVTTLTCAGDIWFAHLVLPGLSIWSLSWEWPVSLNDDMSIKTVKCSSRIPAERIATVTQLTRAAIATVKYSRQMLPPQRHRRGNIGSGLIW